METVNALTVNCRYYCSIAIVGIESLNFEYCATLCVCSQVGVAAKSFIPQLQTSYLKSLNDPNRPVRVQATTGLIELLPLSPRVDPVFNELHNGVKKSEDLGLRLTMLQALCGVIKVGGQRMSEKHRGEILMTLVTLQTTAQEGNRLQAAECIGALCAHLGDQELRTVMTESLLELEGVSDWAVLQARAAALSAALRSASARIVDLGMREEVASAVVSLASSDRVRGMSVHPSVPDFIPTPTLHAGACVCEWLTECGQLHQQHGGGQL